MNLSYLGLIRIGLCIDSPSDSTILKIYLTVLVNNCNVPIKNMRILKSDK